VVEPDLNDPAAALSQENFIEPHAMNPVNVLRMAASMKVPLKRVLLVGCEPATFGGEEGEMGLSPEVEAAVGKAMKLVAGLVERSLNNGKLHATKWISTDLKSAN
jgi:hydrogenase maturation protease